MEDYAALKETADRIEANRKASDEYVAELESGDFAGASLTDICRYANRGQVNVVVPDSGLTDAHLFAIDKFKKGEWTPQNDGEAAFIKEAYNKMYGQSARGSDTSWTMAGRRKVSYSGFKDTQSVGDGWQFTREAEMEQLRGNLIRDDRVIDAQIRAIRGGQRVDEATGAAYRAMHDEYAAKALGVDAEKWSAGSRVERFNMLIESPLYSGEKSEDVRAQYENFMSGWDAGTIVGRLKSAAGRIAGGEGDAFQAYVWEPADDECVKMHMQAYGLKDRRELEDMVFWGNEDGSPHMFKSKAGDLLLATPRDGGGLHISVAKGGLTSMMKGELERFDTEMADERGELRAWQLAFSLANDPELMKWYDMYRSSVDEYGLGDADAVCEAAMESVREVMKPNMTAEESEEFERRFESANKAMQLIGEIHERRGGLAYRKDEGVATHAAKGLWNLGVQMGFTAQDFVSGVARNNYRTWSALYEAIGDRATPEEQRRRDMMQLLEDEAKYVTSGEAVSMRTKFGEGVGVVGSFLMIGGMLKLLSPATVMQATGLAAKGGGSVLEALGRRFQMPKVTRIGVKSAATGDTLVAQGEVIAGAAPSVRDRMRQIEKVEKELNKAVENNEKALSKVLRRPDVAWAASDADMALFGEVMPAEEISAIAAPVVKLDAARKVLDTALAKAEEAYKALLGKNFEAAMQSAGRAFNRIAELYMLGQEQYEKRRGASAYRLGAAIEGSGFDEELFEISKAYDLYDAATSTSVFLLFPMVRKSLVGTAAGRAVQRELTWLSRFCDAALAKGDSAVARAMFGTFALGLKRAALATAGGGLMGASLGLGSGLVEAGRESAYRRHAGGARVSTWGERFDGVWDSIKSEASSMAIGTGGMALPAATVRALSAGISEARGMERARMAQLEWRTLGAISAWAGKNPDGTDAARAALGVPDWLRDLNGERSAEIAFAQTDMLNAILAKFSMAYEEDGRAFGKAHGAARKEVEKTFGSHVSQLADNLWGAMAKGLRSPSHGSWERTYAKVVDARRKIKLDAAHRAWNTEDEEAVRDYLTSVVEMDGWKVEKFTRLGEGRYRIKALVGEREEHGTRTDKSGKTKDATLRKKTYQLIDFDLTRDLMAGAYRELPDGRLVFADVLAQDAAARLDGPDDDVSDTPAYKAAKAVWDTLTDDEKATVRSGEDVKGVLRTMLLGGEGMRPAVMFNGQMLDAATRERSGRAKSPAQALIELSRQLGGDGETVGINTATASHEMVHAALENMRQAKLISDKDYAELKAHYEKIALASGRGAEAWEDMLIAELDERNEKELEEALKKETVAGWDGAFARFVKAVKRAKDLTGAVRRAEGERFVHTDEFIEERLAEIRREKDADKAKETAKAKDADVAESEADAAMNDAVAERELEEEAKRGAEESGETWKEETPDEAEAEPETPADVERPAEAETTEGKPAEAEAKQEETKKSAKQLAFEEGRRRIDAFKDAVKAGAVLMDDWLSGDEWLARWRDKRKKGDEWLVKSGYEHDAAGGRWIREGHDRALWNRLRVERAMAKLAEGPDAAQELEADELARIGVMLDATGNRLGFAYRLDGAFDGTTVRAASPEYEAVSAAIDTVVPLDAEMDSETLAAASRWAAGGRPVVGKPMLTGAVTTWRAALATRNGANMKIVKKEFYDNFVPRFARFYDKREVEDGSVVGKTMDLIRFGDKSAFTIAPEISGGRQELRFVFGDGFRGTGLCYSLMNHSVEGAVAYSGWYTLPELANALEVLAKGGAEVTKVVTQRSGDGGFNLNVFAPSERGDRTLGWRFSFTADGTLRNAFTDRKNWSEVFGRKDEGSKPHIMGRSAPEARLPAGLASGDSISKFGEEVNGPSRYGEPGRPEVGKTALVGNVGLDRLAAAGKVKPQTVRAVRRRTEAQLADIVAGIRKDGLKGRQKRVRNWQVEEALGRRGFDVGLPTVMGKELKLHYTGASYDGKPRFEYAGAGAKLPGDLFDRIRRGDGTATVGSLYEDGILAAAYPEIANARIVYSEIRDEAIAEKIPMVGFDGEGKAYEVQTGKLGVRPLRMRRGAKGRGMVSVMADGTFVVWAESLTAKNRAAMSRDFDEAVVQCIMRIEGWDVNNSYGGRAANAGSVFTINDLRNMMKHVGRRTLFGRPYWSDKAAQFLFALFGDKKLAVESEDSVAMRAVRAFVADIAKRGRRKLSKRDMEDEKRAVQGAVLDELNDAYGQFASNLEARAFAQRFGRTDKELEELDKALTDVDRKGLIISRGGSVGPDASSRVLSYWRENVAKAVAKVLGDKGFKELFAKYFDEAVEDYRTTQLAMNISRMIKPRDWRVKKELDAANKLRREAGLEPLGDADTAKFEWGTGENPVGRPELPENLREKPKLRSPDWGRKSEDGEERPSRIEGIGVQDAKLATVREDDKAAPAPTEAVRYMTEGLNKDTREASSRAEWEANFAKAIEEFRKVLAHYMSRDRRAGYKDATEKGVELVEKYSGESVKLTSAERTERFEELLNAAMKGVLGKTMVSPAEVKGRRWPRKSPEELMTEATAMKLARVRLGRGKTGDAAARKWLGSELKKMKLGGANQSDMEARVWARARGMADEIVSRVGRRAEDARVAAVARQVSQQREVASAIVRAFNKGFGEGEGEAAAAGRANELARRAKMGMIRRAKGKKADEVNAIMGGDVVRDIIALGEAGARYASGADFAKDMVARAARSFADGNPEFARHTDEELAESEVVRAEVGKVVSGWLKAVAQKLSYGKVRQDALRAAARLDHGAEMTMYQMQRLVGFQAERIANYVRKTTTAEYIDLVEKVIDRTLGKGRLAEGESTAERAVPPEEKAFWTYAKRAMRTTKGRSDARIAELTDWLSEQDDRRARLAAERGEGVVAKNEDLREYAAKTLELSAYMKYGGMRDRHWTEAKDVFDHDVSVDLGGAVAEFVAKQKARLAEYAQARRDMIGALAEQRRRDGGTEQEAFRGRVGRNFLVNSVADLFRRMQLFFPEGSEAYERIEEFRRAMSMAHIRRAQYVSSWELAMREAFKEIYGKSFEDSIDELSLQREEYARFSRNGWGVAEDAPEETVSIDGRDVKIRRATPGTADEEGIPREAQRLSKDQLIYIYAATRQEDMRVNNEVWGRDAEYMRDLEDAIGPEGVAFADWLVGSFGRIREQVSPVCEGLTGIRVTSPDRLYVPLRFEQDRVSVDVREFSASPFPSFLISRRNHDSMRLDETVDAARMFEDKVNDTGHYVAFAPIIDATAYTFRDPKVQDAYARVYGTKAKNDMYSQMVEALVGGRRASTGFGEGVRNFVTATSLFGNVASAIKQLEGVGGWSVEMGVVPWVKALVGGRGWAFAGEETRDAMRTLEDAGVFATRGSEGLSEAMAALMNASDGYERGAARRLYQKYKENGMTLTRAVDRIASRSFAAAYFVGRRDFYVERGMTAEAAERNAIADTDYAIQTTQQSGRPEFFHWAQRQGAIGKMLTQFSGPAFVRWGIEVEQMHRAFVLGDKGAKRKLLSRMVALHLVCAPMLTAASAIANMVLGRPSGDGDEAWDKLMCDAIASALVGPMSGWFIWGQMVNSGVSQLATIGESKGGMRSRHYEAPVLSKIGNLVHQTGKLASDVFEAASAGDIGDVFSDDAVREDALAILMQLMPAARLITPIRRIAGDED